MRTRILFASVAIVSAVAVGAFRGGPAPSAFPEPAIDNPVVPGAAPESAVLAGGCFWGVQAVFQHVKGVVNATSGYAGGSEKNARYDIVSRGSSGHAESVRVVYDASQVSFGQLLRIFFAVAHDPTELNRQGPDEGTQYRSVIFYSGQRQREIADAYVEQLTGAKVYRHRIVTQIVPLEAFYPAEEYHQNYYTRHPYEPYIMINDRPKVDALKKFFASVYVAR
ncbi:MAG TPA: peptide-methionine (S)-S-oxide reductase MsrA [Vicinamibacterales bacterium]|jgi:peptide-methionine (S)-S-oxide reductase